MLIRPYFLDTMVAVRSDRNTTLALIPQSVKSRTSPTHRMKYGTRDAASRYRRRLRRSLGLARCWCLRRRAGGDLCVCESARCACVGMGVHRRTDWHANGLRRRAHALRSRGDSSGQRSQEVGDARRNCGRVIMCACASSADGNPSCCAHNARVE